MRLFSRVPLLGSLAVVVSAIGCADLLEIQQRELDVNQLTDDGYTGCQPMNRNCESCTSEWHQCICDGWNVLGELELRWQCAEQAPEEIREAELQRAEAAYRRVVRPPVEPPDEPPVEPPDEPPVEPPDEPPVEPPDEPPVEPPDEPVEPPGEPEPPPEEPVVFDAAFCEREVNRESDCFQCFCDQCSVRIATCASVEQCSRIMTCALNRDCDPTVRGDNSCDNDVVCGMIIAMNGGFNGDPYDLVKNAVGCAQAQGCPCQDQAPVAPELPAEQ